jgi:hypothetical protein
MSSDRPLTLQVGQVTSAVDDLVDGYERLLQKIPELAVQLSDIQSGTLNMANDLQVKISIHSTNFYNFYG